MPMAVKNRFAGGPKVTHCPMPAPDETPKIEGVVDGTRAKDQSDATSRKAGTSGRVVNLGKTPAATETRPPMYGGKKR